MAGYDRQGSSKGPRRFIEVGAPQLLSGKGLDVVQESIDRGPPFQDTGSASLAVGKQTAQFHLVSCRARLGNFSNLAVPVKGLQSNRRGVRGQLRGGEDFSVILKPRLQRMRGAR
jgi:hypothetical protein